MGLQGPQGCGKSTVAAAVIEALGERGVRAATVSIDDFYLTRAEQLALSARHPDNPYLLYRGYPGTHDVALGAATIDALKALGPGDELAIPTYDKSAHGGRGDRAPRDRWRRVRGPLDVIVVEGWMLGFSAASPEALEPALRMPNDALRAYVDWHRRLDAFVSLRAPSLDIIVHWRIDAERARRERGEQALSDDEARDYIERFLPAYRAWAPGLAARPPCPDTWAVDLDDDRRPRGDQ